MIPPIQPPTNSVTLQPLLQRNPTGMRKIYLQMKGVQSQARTERVQTSNLAHYKIFYFYYLSRGGQSSAVIIATGF